MSKLKALKEAMEVVREELVDFPAGPDRGPELDEAVRPSKSTRANALIDKHRAQLRQVNDDIERVVKSGGRLAPFDPLNQKLSYHVRQIKKLKKQYGLRKEENELNEVHEHAKHLFGHGWDVHDASREHQAFTHPEKPGHVVAVHVGGKKDGHWEHIDWDGDGLVAKGSSAKSLASHLSRAHGVREDLSEGRGRPRKDGSIADEDSGDSNIVSQLRKAVVLRGHSVRFADGKVAHVGPDEARTALLKHGDTHPSRRLDFQHRLGKSHSDFRSALAG